MRSLTNILFLNTHSVLNSGDAGIVLAQIQFFRQRFPGIQISITSRTPHLDEPFYKPMGIRVLSPLIPVPSLYSGAVEKVWNTLRESMSVSAKNRLWKEIQKSELVIASGGGYFFSNRKNFPGPMFFQNYLPVKLASFAKKPVVFFPQSFGPMFNSVASRFVKDLLKEPHILNIFVRENISAEYLQRLLAQEKNLEKVVFCPDFAFMLDGANLSGGETWISGQRRPIVAVTLRTWDFPETQTAEEKKVRQKKYFSFFEDICQKIIADWGGSILILAQARGPGFYEDDRIICQKLWKRVSSGLPREQARFINLPDRVSPLSLVQIFSQVDLLIATRFHSAIYAFLAGRPAIALAYQPKSSGMMETLGLGRYCLGITEVNTHQALKLAQELLEQSDQIRQQIREQIDSARKAIVSKVEKSLEEWLA